MLEIIKAIIYGIVEGITCRLYTSFPAEYGKINSKETFATNKKWTFIKRKRIFRR